MIISNIVCITGHVAHDGRIAPFIFVNPCRINGHVVTKISATLADLNCGLTAGQEIYITFHPNAKLPVLCLDHDDYPNSADCSLSLCPQCGTPLIRRKKQLYCPGFCQNSDFILQNEIYSNMEFTHPKWYSVDPLMYQFIARQNNARLMPVVGNPNIWKLHFNNAIDIVNIGFSLGLWMKKLQPYGIPKSRKQINSPVSIVY